MMQITLVLLIIMAIVAVQTQKLRNAVIYLGVFSLCMSFVFLLYNAPDVAIAEAVIGSTLASILYMVALQKHKVFTIYYRVYSGEASGEYKSQKKRLELIKLLEMFCTEQELEPHIIFTTEEKETIMELHGYSIIIVAQNDELILYGPPENCKIDVLEDFMLQSGPLPYPYKLIKCCEVIE